MKKTLNELRGQLDEQIKENNRLRELCEKAGIDTTKKTDSNATPSERIVYRGKERDEDWFNRMYERFYDKIALSGDKFVDLRTFKPKNISSDFVEMGTVVSTLSPSSASIGMPKELGEGQSYGGLALRTLYARKGQFKVISVIRDGEALIDCTTGQFVFHICGYEHPLIDGQKFDDIGNLICVGTYKYATAQGNQKTVQSFKVWDPKPLTKEQFEEALKSGFELVNYVEKQGKTVMVPIR
jgi:hypothetical protein